MVKLITLVFGIASIINLMWPRTPEAGWLNKWLILISMVVLIALGLIQLVMLNMSKEPMQGQSSPGI